MRKNLVVAVSLLILILSPSSFPATRSTTTEEGYKEKYVILTNIDENDQYYSGVSLLKDYRNAQAIHFQDFINDTITELKALKPNFIAIIVKPDNITREFVEKTLQKLKQIDDDNSIDSAIGFLTAATSNELENLVSNTIQAEKEQHPQKFISMFYPREQSELVLGNDPINPTQFSNAQAQTDFFSEIGWETATINLYTTTPPEIYPIINHPSFITLTMHGNGTYVEGLNSSDVRAGPNQYLYPAVTIALPCYSGIASEKIYSSDKNNEYEEFSIFYDPEDTFALSFIKKGCIGYVGHLKSGGNNLGILQPALYGMVFLNMTQGEAMTYAYNKNLMIPAKPSPDWEHDLFSYLIYGDPAYKPVTNPLAPPILKGSTIVNPNHIDLELKFTQNVTLPTPLPEGNYNDEDKWSGVFSLPLHYQHAIPKNYEVTSVSVSSFNDPDGKITSIELHSWIIEETWNKQNLHIAFDLTWDGLHNICENTIISLKLDVNQLEPEPTPKPTPSSTPEPEKTNFDIEFDKDDYRVETISNSTVKDLIFKQTEKTLQLKIDGTTGTNGFCNTTFPKVLLSGDFTVFMDATMLVGGIDYTVTSNSTHHTLSITYNHSTHTIEIVGTTAIPDFAGWLLLPFVMLATLLALALNKRLKKQKEPI